MLYIKSVVQLLLFWSRSELSIPIVWRSFWRDTTTSMILSFRSSTTAPTTQARARSVPRDMHLSAFLSFVCHSFLCRHLTAREKNGNVEESRNWGGRLSLLINENVLFVYNTLELIFFLIIMLNLSVGRLFTFWWGWNHTQVWPSVCKAESSITPIACSVTSLRPGPVFWRTWVTSKSWYDEIAWLNSDILVYRYFGLVKYVLILVP